MKLNTNDPTILPNMIRSANENLPEKLLPEVELCVQAYYSLYDQMEGFPNW